MKYSIVLAEVYIKKAHTKHPQMNLGFLALKIYREHCSFGESLCSLFVHSVRSSRQHSSVAGDFCLVP